MEYQTANLCDLYGDNLSVCEMNFKSYGKKTAFYGPIKTVRAFEDNLLVREALGDIESGSVLVVDGGGSLNCALLGDQLATMAMNRNISGVIINGGVRDVSDLENLELGILALGTNPKKSKKNGSGDRNVPLFFGGVHWHTGEYVYADKDGVVISKVKR